MKDADKTKKQLKNALPVKQRPAKRRTAKADGKRAGKSPKAGKSKIEDYRDIAIDIAGAIILVINREGKVTHINKRGYEVLGYGEREIIGKNWFENFIPPAIRNDLLSVSKKLLSGDIALTEYHENPVLTKSGEERIIAWHNTVLRDSHGHIISLLSSGEDVTERKRIQDSLRKSEKRFRDLANLLPQVVFEVDIKGNITFVNRYAFELTGYTPEDFTGVNALQMVAPQDRDRLAKDIQRRLAGEQLGFREYDMVRKDGTTFPALADSNPIIVENKVVGLRGIVIDMTSQKEAEAALLASEQKYRLFVENVGQPISIIQDSLIKFGNPKLAEITGYSLEELTSMKALALVHPDDREMALSYRTRRMKGEKVPDSYTVRIVDKQGNTRWLLRNVTQLAWEGKPAALILDTDITERKKIEEALRESEERYRTLAESSLTGIFIAQDGKYVYVNNNFARLHGYEPKEMLGMDFAQLVPPDEREAINEIMAKYLKGEISSTTYKRRRIRKDGSLFWSEVRVSAIQYRGKLGILGNLIDISEQHHTEEALKQSEQRLKEAQALGRIGDWEYDIATQKIEWSDEVYEIFERDRALGPPSVEEEPGYYAPEEATRLRKFNNSVIKRGIEGSIDSTAKLPSGKTVFLSAHIRPIKDESGRVIKLFGTIQDITDRKQMEQALRESEQRYRAIFEQASDSIILTDSETLAVVDFNETACLSLGYTPKEFARLRVSDFEAVESADEIMKHSQNIINKGAETFETKHKTKNGELRDVQSNTRPLVIGNKSFVLGVSRDITDQKRIEEKLRESEERYRAIFEQATDSIILTDFDTLAVVDFNDTACHNLGYSREEFSKLTVYDFEAVEPRGELKKHRQRTSTKTDEIVETKHRTKSGELRDVIVSVRPITIGGRLFTLGVSRDVTDQKRLEEQQKQLEQKAQFASRLASVGELASGVAHEINNPLTGVIGYAHLLLIRDDLPQDMRHDIEIINEGSQRVASIVRKLLAFARQSKPQRSQVDINEIIATTLDLRAYELKTDNIKVATRFQPDLPTTIADSGQLQQVFLNLIINAETAMKLTHGRGKLLIATERFDSTIRISFKDNGPGILKQDMNRVFEPFFTTREVGQGTGLGLSVCHGIISEHQGKIHVASKPGKGATFIVDLPIINEDKQLEFPEPSVEEPEKMTGARILVVDDELLIRRFVSRVLREEGHKVETADKAEDALKKIKSERYSLILLDIKMPGMSGIELYQQILEIAPSLKRRVTFITGDTLGAQTTAFLASSKASYIMKPFDANQFKADINRLLAANTLSPDSIRHSAAKLVV